MENYKKLEVIGKGNFSQVWLAVRQDGSRAILKQYNSADMAEARREYLFLLAAQNVNSPKGYDFFEDEEGVWLAMEYIEGKELKYGFFENNKELGSFFLKLATQIVKLHSLGICLNDIKPENIKVKDGEPWLLDFGLATPNNFNDGIFRGNLALTSPEKLLYNRCHFGGDNFAIGLMYHNFKVGRTKQDYLEAGEWQRIIGDEEKWQDWLQTEGIDGKLSDILSWSALNRAGDNDLLEYFSEISNSSRNPLPILADLYRFSAQEKLAKKLLKIGYLDCSNDDEPERIADLVQLHCEAEGVQLLIFREDQLATGVDELLKYSSKALGIKLDHLLDIKKMNREKVSILVLGKSPQAKLPFIKKVADSLNLYYLRSDNIVTPQKVMEEEYITLRNICGLNEPKGEYRGYSITGARLEIKLETREITELKRNPLRDISGYLGCWIPVNTASAWEEDWALYLAEGIKSGDLQLAGSSFKAVTPKENYQVNDLLERYISKAEEIQDYYISGKLYFALGKKDEGKQDFIKYYRELIKRGSIVPAWHLITEMAEYLTWKDMGFRLQKAQAFLARQIGDIEFSIELYKKITVEPESDKEAIINSDLAICMQEIGELEKSVSLYKKALEHFRRTGDHKSELRCLNNMAAIYYEDKDYNQCSSIYQEIIRITEKLPEMDYAKNYNLVSQINLADVFLHKAQWKRAMIYARNAAFAGEKMRLPNFMIRSEVIGLLAQFAQQEIEGASEIINEILQSNTLQENPALYADLLVYLLPVLQYYDPMQAIMEIKSQKENGFEDLSDELLLTICYVSWQQRDLLTFFEAKKCLNKEVYNELLEPLERAEYQTALEKLRELSRGDDCWLYIYYGYQIALSGNNTGADDIGAILDIYSFYPLEELKKSSKKSAPEGIGLLWEIVSMIHNKVEFSEIIREVLTGMIRTASLERAIFFEFENGNLTPKLGFDKNLQILDPESIQVSETILLNTLESNEIRFLTGLQDEENFDIHSSIFGLGLRSAVCFPLHFEGSIQGVIYSDARTKQEFSTEEKKLLESILIQGRSAYEKVVRLKNMQSNQISQLILDDPISGSTLQGKSEKMQKIFRLIETVGRHNVNILITGETGTGKELIARSIHRNYAEEKPFIPVNCAAIPETLLESELFGYVKGAFTGADSNKLGLIQAAAGGTLFLDEIGDMPVSLQAKLLRVIQERQVTPLGSNKSEEVNIRIVAATNQELESRIQSGQFRSDLYYRLKVIKIDIPPLRERREDVPLLVRYFISRYNERFQKDVKKINIQALDFLQNQPFPGNVRELENTMERAMVLCEGDELTLDLFEVEKARSGFSLYDNIPLNWDNYKNYRKGLMTNLDSVYIQRLMKKAEGNAAAAGRLGKISRTQIYRLLNNSDE